MRECEARLVFTPSPTLETVALSRFLAAASEAMLTRFADVEGVSPPEVARTHHVTCSTRFDPQTGWPSYILALVRREEVATR